MKHLLITLRGCSLAGILGLSSIMAWAEPGQLTLDDLREALQSSETPESLTSVTGYESEMPELPTGLLPAASVSNAELQRAILTAGTHKKAKTAATAPPVLYATTSETASDSATVRRVPSQPRRAEVYPSDPTKWVCKVSMNDAPVATALTDRAAGWDDGMMRLYFETGDFAVNKAGIVALARRSSKLRDLVAAGDQVAVIGNTDTLGNASSNIILSLQRAYNTKACVMEFTGIGERDIFLFGYGNVSPLLERQDKSQAGNRRVDVIALSEYRRRFEDTFSKLNQ